MIIWIASYPKNGNTWLRALISAYYFTESGFFLKDKQLNNIKQFPSKEYFNGFDYDCSVPGATSKYWIAAQDKINNEKKIRFLKTHSALVKLGNNNFTNKKNTLAAIYIVRDPRNVLDSMSRHFQISYDEALKTMLDQHNFTYDFKKKNDFSDYQFTSSWEKNYQSWKNNKLFPVKFLRYEDLSNKTFTIFKEVIEFINKNSFIKKGFNRQKALNAVSSTSFDKLKNLEKESGFIESIVSRKEKKLIPFFQLGPNNSWKKNFNQDYINYLNNVFKKNLFELKYLR